MEKKLNSFIISFFVLLALFALLVALFIMFPLFDNGDYYIKETDTPSVDALADDNGNMLRATEDYGQEYIDKIIFLGESTTYGLQRYGVLSGGTDTRQVWTGAMMSGGKTVSAGTLSLSPSIAQAKIYYPDTGEALTVAQALRQKKPEYMIITLGLNNGVSYYNEYEFKQCYRMLLNSINDSYGNTKIILQSLFPVSQSCQINAYTPRRIDECNGWIYEIAQEYDIKFLNTAEVLKNDEGYLLPEYDNGGDGIHLNRLGLTAVIDYIKTHGYGG